MQTIPAKKQPPNTRRLSEIRPGFLAQVFVDFLTGLHEALHRIDRFVEHRLFVLRQLDVDDTLRLMASCPHLHDQVGAARAQFKEESPDQALGKVIMVVCCEGSVCAMTTNDEQWLELRSRTSLYTENDVEPVMKILSPLVENAGSDAQIIFMGDPSAEPVKELIESSLNGRRFSDVSQPDQLWSLMKQY